MEEKLKFWRSWVTPTMHTQTCEIVQMRAWLRFSFSLLRLLFLLTKMQLIFSYQFYFYRQAKNVVYNNVTRSKRMTNNHTTCKLSFAPEQLKKKYHVRRGVAKWRKSLRQKVQKRKILKRFEYLFFNFSIRRQQWYCRWPLTVRTDKSKELKFKWSQDRGCDSRLFHDDLISEKNAVQQ